MCCLNISSKRCNKVYPGGSPNFGETEALQYFWTCILYIKVRLSVYKLKSSKNRNQNCLTFSSCTSAIFTFCGFIQILLLAKIPFPKWLLATNCINPNKFGIAEVEFGLVYKNIVAFHIFVGAMFKRRFGLTVA